MRGSLLAVGAWLVVYGSATMAGMIAHYGISVPEGPPTILYWGAFGMANVGGFLFISAFPRIKE